MAAGPPDYRNTVFEFSTLPKHSGEPSFAIIRAWHNLLKANAGKVHTSLGGGTNGYLGLLLSDLAYALISQAPFVRPALPPPLLIPLNSSNRIIVTLQDTHKEAIRVFRECEGVEKALQSQLVEAVEDIYISALRDANTNAINLPIRDIIQYLYNTYGDIPPESLSEERQIVEDNVYDIFPSYRYYFQ